MKLFVQVLGALWYLFSVQRQESCWREACLQESPACQTMFFDCKTGSGNRTIWYELSNITSLCTTSSGFYPFGIYGEALDANLMSSSFTQKYFYCFWWGLKNLRYVDHVWLVGVSICRRFRSLGSDFNLSYIPNKNWTVA